MDDDGGGLEEWKDGEGECRHNVDGAADGADVAELQLLLVAPAQPRELDVVEPAEKELSRHRVRAQPFCHADELAGSQELGPQLGPQLEQRF